MRWGVADAVVAVTVAFDVELLACECAAGRSSVQVRRVPLPLAGVLQFWS